MTLVVEAEHKKRRGVRLFFFFTKIAIGVLGDYSTAVYLLNRSKKLTLSS